MGDDRSSVYSENTITVYRASALGGCQKSLVLTRAGIEGKEAPENIQAAYRTGSKLEDRIVQRACEDYGVRCLDKYDLVQYGKVQENGQVETEIKVGSKAVVRCHPDGIVQVYESETLDVGQQYVLEVKALGKQLANKIESDLSAMSFYEWQFAVEMVSTGLPGMYVIAEKCEKCKGTGHKLVEGDKEWPLKCEECKGEAFEIRSVKFFDKPPKNKAEIIRRVMELEKLGKRFDEGEKIECDVKQYPCPYYELHEGGIWEEEEDDSHKVTSEIQMAIRHKAQEAKTLQDEIKPREERFLRLKEEIKELLGKAGVKKYKRDGIRFNEVMNKGRVDTKKMEEDGVDVEKYRKGDTVVRKIEFVEEKDAR